MTYIRLPATLPARLREAGLHVVVVGDWLATGRPASKGDFDPVGVLNHHTGSCARSGDLADDLSYAKHPFHEGRPDLPAPNCHASLSVEATVYLGAGGRANHAGTAKSVGSVAAGDGNELYVGIEWMLSGTQKIPADMYHAGAVFNAVVLDLLGSSPQAAACHYQTSVTGKWDIGHPHGIPFHGQKVMDVDKFRRAVASVSAKPKATRLSNFWDGGPQWDVRILDRAAEQRDDVRAVVKRIDVAVNKLPKNEGNTLVGQFVAGYKKDRHLRMGLLNTAVKNGRHGTVEHVRDEIRHQLFDALPKR